MTDKDGFTRLNIIFPKDDNTTLALIDSVRGSQSRSSAMHRMLEYICQNGPDTVRGIITSRHKPQAQEQTQTQPQV